MKKTDFEIVESKRWKHASGLTASIYGAVPWTSETDKNNWTIEPIGFTLRNIKSGIIGIGRKPFETYQEAEEFIASFN